MASFGTSDIIKLTFFLTLCFRLSNLTAVDVNDILDETEAEIQASVSEFQAQWTSAKNSKLFHAVSLTPKQQAWFDSLRPSSGDPQQQSSTGSISMRKEVRQLTSGEWKRYVEAMWETQNTYPDPDQPMSEYGLLVSMHRTEMSPGAHGGAGFLPWHREYLLRMEQAMKSHDPGVSLVYWDNSLDQLLPDPSESVMWSDYLLGHNIGLVDDGPFAYWPIISECHFPSGNLLSRNAPPNEDFLQTLSLFNDTILNRYWSLASFKELMHPEVQYEFLHGRGHLSIRGHMGELLCSPSDPIFWMHHSFIDYIWEEFRQNSQQTNRESDYLLFEEPGHGDEFHLADSYMRPFDGLKNIDGLSDDYTKVHFNYAPRVVACKRQADCGSPYLWCDTTRGRCISKIRAGGDCTNLPHRACYKSRCRSGVCE